MTIFDDIDIRPAEIVALAALGGLTSLLGGMFAGLVFSIAAPIFVAWL